MEDKNIYIIGEKAFKLKREFTIDDMEIADELDKIFKPVQAKAESGEITLQAGKVSKEDFINLCDYVLIPVEGEKPEREFFRQTPMPVFYKIYCDFFFVYWELSLAIQTHSIDLEKRAKELLMKFAEKKNDSK